MRIFLSTALPVALRDIAVLLRRKSDASHTTLLEVSAVENERLIPQQGVAFVTTVDDIETFIDGYEPPNRQLLFALDLPVSERDLVLDDLRYMGITAGSHFFPGA